MTTSGFDIEEKALTDLIADAISDSMDYDWTARDGARSTYAALVPLLTEIRELRAENARLKEALSHAQGRFLNINIALSSGGTKREAIRIADVGEDCAKNALARAALGEPQ